ncbi:MAG: MotA/TolQ/ExbB proton channel family protein [Candidatus Thiodiazotropha lotti]|uniref:MotA/TolQ/ExbB proton channel family protein n=1 Tax=Candidatus Thiodiazotropha lotti TaxID=2792787 RepID=A0A9E4K3W5_9GAMM|nr:MotA/TolQ/ExbB proton channel family protein [Candidatus Thiodiazotropha lotti]MCG7920319.1 MotA/TolQ/ExbB proton channel family protein [Candidatus Thiodiazotropha lotti]MCG7931055.1 MotA/TolQ/ExbB proton channel family protein [Candidatus Thiodiazotropha lotti]MCG7938574.1 MotA/TolQ/ExbB proton channel family protein [Candidatus Thiodiazotropha lotti]MCG8005780.1 MotA/TolQ/ExbB proton channel family protein [Candidatus Thiodiazotropha lotti]
MNRLLIIITLLIGVFVQQPMALAAEDSLQSLLEEVKKSRQAQQSRDQAREKRFLEQHQQRKSALEAIKQKLQAEQQRQQQLLAQFEAQREELEKLKLTHQQSTGSFGELFGVVRQVASESLNLFKNDLTSSRQQQDLAILEEVASSRSLPSLERLQDLWEIFLTRIIQSGQIWQASLPVILTSGEEQQEQVTVVGLFNALSNGRYLRYLPETARFVELSRQPAPRYQLLAKQAEQSDGGLQKLAIDPSRGAILSLLVASPTLSERIQQGGYIGYFILFLGALGSLVIIERLVSLFLVGRRVKRQLKQEEPMDNNPLGRLLAIDRLHHAISGDALQKHFDEAILRELPKLRRGLRLLAIFAAVAPLLGLLGTVTGMIETFQSITLFGTGDPKLMSGGISQALVTTELGLAVAIPMVLLHSYLAGRSNRVIRLLDQQSAAMVAARTGS